jgi:hypothetical protein
MKRRVMLGCVLALLPLIGVWGCTDTTTAPDTTPPLAPHLDGATLNNGSVGVWWEPNTEPDLAGYYVYLVIDGTPQSAVPHPIADNSLVVDLNGSTGPVDVYVTAIDVSGNESSPSTSVRAKGANIDLGRPITDDRPADY